MIEVQNLNYSYGKQQILKDVNFTVKKGEVLGVLGPNGSGKSTLFHCIEGMLTDYEGTIKILENEAKNRNKDVLSKIGVQLQSTHFFNKIKVLNFFTLLLLSLILISPKMISFLP